MRKWNNQPKFNALKDEWYRRLEESGFNDIEQSEDCLKSWTAYGVQLGSTLHYETNSEYYRLAGFFLNENTFKNEVEKYIWSKHSQGLSLDSIMQHLRAEKSITMTRAKVRRRVERLAKQMFERYKVK